MDDFVATAWEPEDIEAGNMVTIKDLDGTEARFLVTEVRDLYGGRARWTTELRLLADPEDSP
jgi:hypothetical protein